jgi:uncharacterized protein involved in exopolysaccharide biosynthesis
VKQNLTDIITKLVEIAWRRRLLLALPIAIMLPLSFLASRMLPQTYVSKALLAMQESGSDNPLIKTNGNSIDRLRERAPGLQALLKSDRVLNGALHDIMGETAPTEPRRMALAVQELDAALTFEMIGTDFLELQLKGRREGLGRKLEAVTARFLESLVATDQDSTSAVKVLLDKRRDDLTVTEAALQKYRDQLGPRTLAAFSASEVRMSDLQNSLPALTADLANVEAEITALKGNLGPIDAPDAALRVAQLQALEQRNAALKSTLKQSTATLADLTRSSNDARSPEGQLHKLERDVREAQTLLDGYQKRFPAALTQRSLQVLNAPERIRVIDPPRDPEFPTTPRSRIIVLGIALGLLLAGAWTAAAELLDQRLRTVADFESAAGVPVIARLPRGNHTSPPQSERASFDDPATDETTSRSSTHRTAA